MVKIFANSEDPNQTPQNAASDLGLHCLPITLFVGPRTNMSQVSAHATNIFYCHCLNKLFINEIDFIIC